jgi:hypothetical protein
MLLPSLTSSTNFERTAATHCMGAALTGGSARHRLQSGPTTRA